MTIATKPMGGRRLSEKDQGLPAVIAITERCFVGAGDNLAMAVETLNRTKAIFTRLETTLGDDTGQQLSQLIATVMGNLAGIRAKMEELVLLGDASRGAVRRVRAEVGELDRIVRSIASVSVNARILGNVLMPPRAQVNAFIDRLAELSGEGEAVLAEVKEAVAGIGEDTQAMDLILDDLRQDLLEQILPTLSHIATIAQSFEDGRGEMAKVSAGLADQMREVFSEVSRLIIALQVGDSTRQRLQRVQSVIETQADPDRAAKGKDHGLDHVLTKLARDLVDAAKTEAQSDIALSIAALDRVRIQADSAMQQARQFYFARTGLRRPGGAGAEAPEKLEESRLRVQDHIVTLRERAEVMCRRLEAIMGHEVTIRRITHAVRLSGLNAVIVCAKLGTEGRALRELALWLRALIDESDVIEGRLHCSLSETRDHTEQGIGAGVDHLDAALSSFVSDTGRLNNVMKRINAVVAEAAKGFDLAGRRLPLQIGQGLDELQTFRAALGDLDGLSVLLGARATMQARPAAPFDAASEEAMVLSQLRATYTMQQERAIHDATLAGLLAPSGGPDATDGDAEAPTPQDAAAQSDEPDLDDIFF